MIKKIAVLAFAALALVGCGVDTANGGNPIQPKDYVTAVYQVDGKPLTCLIDRFGQKSQTMSCDWVAYHGLDK